jgi:hypothetical protein
MYSSLYQYFGISPLGSHVPQVLNLVAEHGIMTTLFLHPNISTYVYTPTSYCMATNLMSVNTVVPITCTGYVIALLHSVYKHVSNF